MSRTVAIRTIAKVKQEEIVKFEQMTRSEIIRSYDQILSLFEKEYLSDTYSSMQKYLTKIETVDGHILYIAHTKIVEICSDNLLAKEIEERICDYEVGTYRDITDLEGQKLTATETKFRRIGNEPSEVQEVKRTMKFKIPKVQKGVRIFFYDDMG